MIKGIIYSFFLLILRVIVYNVICILNDIGLNIINASIGIAYDTPHNIIAQV